MRYLLAAAAAVAGLAAPSNAAVLTLETVTTNGVGDFTFVYQATLDVNEGLRRGDRFVIFDFAGYIDGSVASASTSPLLVASSELVTSTPLMPPEFTDDPTIFNLVFTYNGSGFRTSGGPHAAFEIDGLSARSTFGGRSADGFFARTTKHDPSGGANSSIYTLGAVTIPAPGNNPDAVPEPASWAMMLGGFGLLGGMMRRRRGIARVTYA